MVDLKGKHAPEYTVIGQARYSEGPEGDQVCVTNNTIIAEHQDWIDIYDCYYSNASKEFASKYTIECNVRRAIRILTPDDMVGIMAVEEGLAPDCIVELDPLIKLIKCHKEYTTRRFEGWLIQNEYEKEPLEVFIPLIFELIT